MGQPIRSCRMLKNLYERMDEITEKEKPRVIIDAAGVNLVVKQAIKIVRKGGEIIKIGFDKRPYQESLDDHFGFWNNGKKDNFWI